MATEACGGGTPDLGYVLGVSVYIRGFGAGNKSRGSPRRPRGRVPRDSPGPSSDAPWVSFGPKIISVNVQVNWTPFGFSFFAIFKNKEKTETGIGL